MTDNKKSYQIPKKEEGLYCLVAGSRSYENYEEFEKTMDFFLKEQAPVILVSGGAKGADHLAEIYAEKHGIPIKVFPADWERLGRKAGPIRNEEMHKYISEKEKRCVICFWDMKSRGTGHSLNLSRQYNNPLYIYNFLEHRFVWEYDWVGSWTRVK